MLIIAMVSCKKPYNPPAISTGNSYLVVEGVICNGSDSTIIKLSSTVGIANKTTYNPVTKAVLTIENDQNQIYSLTETSTGHYSLAGLNLDVSRKYRLRIKTADNNTYLSDFVPVLNAPPVDTVSYAVQSAGVAVAVSTHDPQNNVHYYRWTYQETWIFHSNYFSGYVSNGDTVTERALPANQVYQCWGNDTSSTILLGSSANLKQDVVSNLPVTFVSSTSEKFTSKYSINVIEYAITGDAFNYWQNLKKNTEQLGSIFDSQPSEIQGNIHCITKPSEPVIGYISAGGASAKRIFITTQQLPNWLPVPAYTTCEIDSIYLRYLPAGAAVAIDQENEYFNYNKKIGFVSLLTPVGAIIYNNPILGDIIIGHSGALPECVDCTLRGTNKEPTFWR